MTFRMIFTRLAMVGALVFGWASDGQAGSTGKINGVVTDINGTPLPGANIVLTGTRQGATSDADGYYFILSVDPGSHFLEASLVGYTTERREGIRVQADFTSKADFSLMEAAIELGEMVVIAERPAVEPDKTMSIYIVGADDIQNVPLARTAAEVIELLPGVSLDGNMRIRGSHTAGRTTGTNEIFVELDGIRLANDDGMMENNAMSQVNTLSRGALQEVQVLAGGMDAEYGNAQAGVIRMVSAEGKDHYAGGIEYRSTLPGIKHWGKNVYQSPMLEGRGAGYSSTDYDKKLGHFVEANFSGPISQSLGFFASSKTTKNAPLYPNSNNSQPFNIQNSANLTHRPSANFKFKLGGTLAFSDAYNDGAGGTQDYFGGTSATPPGGTRGIAQQGSNLFIPEGFSAGGKSPRTDTVLYGVFTHTVSPKTFYEVRLSYQNTKLDTSGVPSTTGDLVRDDNGFYLGRKMHTFTYADRSRMILKADVSSQATKGHFFKAGIEYIRNDLYQHEETFTDARTRNLRLVGEGDPVLGMKPFHPVTFAAYIQDKMEFEGLVVNAGIRYDKLSPGRSYGRAMDTVTWNHYNSVTRWRNVEVVENSNSQTAVSPRLGISHPITEKSTIRFFTGRFHQFTMLQHLYNRSWKSTTPDKDLNGNGQIDQKEIFNALKYPLAGEFGNVNMKPERTTNFEVGVDWNFYMEYVLGLTAFYKDQEGTLSSGGSDFFLDEPFAGFNSSYTHGVFNRKFSTSRGIELSLNKSFSQYTSFNIAYNLNWSKNHRGGKSSWEWFIAPDASYINSDKFFAGVTVDADGQERPKAPTSAERAAMAGVATGIIAKYQEKADKHEAKSNAYWESPVKLEPGLYSFNIANYGIPNLESGIDRRNFASVQFLFSAPPDFHVKPLAGFRATFVWQMQSGTAFNYSPPAGSQERRSGPITTLTDASFERDFNVGDKGIATAFVEVRNLFGQRDNTGTGFNWIQAGLQLPAPGDSKFDKYGDINELTRYNGGLGRPRNIVIGARLKF